MPFFENLYFIPPLIASIFYLALAKISLVRFGGLSKITYYFVALASFAIALIPALQFSGKWITFAWLVEALVLVLIFAKLKIKSFFHISLVMLAVGIFRLLFFDSYLRVSNYVNGKWVSDFTPIFNERVLIYAFGILITFSLAYVDLKKEHKKWAKALGALGNLLIL